ncbi:endospore germination permease [Paenibacillus sp. HJGM_3]|uniref:GerAB/ArcD/ProY family transporter n=1 Tax=Paenibacillus sp. HJGM_3 TaxID=3379816 RepID=UPI00385DF062
MQDNGKISHRQFIVLVYLYSVGTTILVIPSGLAAASKQDAWLGAVAGIAIGAIILFLYFALWRLYPGKSFVGICEAVLGRWLGFLIGLIFSFYSFIGAATVLFYVGDFFKTQFLPQTPLVLINAFFAFIVVMGVRLGLETLGRSSELMLPWFLFLFVVLLATLAPEMKPENMLPIFETGWMPMINSGFDVAGTAYFPILFLFALIPNVQNPGKARIGMLLAALLAGISFMLMTLLCIWILGADITARSMFPSYALVKKINIGNFFQRIEAVMAGLWFVTTYFKTTFYYYGWTSSFSELLRLKSSRTLTLPFGILLVVFSIVVYPNTVYMQNWDSTVFLPYIITMCGVIPLLLLIVGGVKRMINPDASQPS